MIATPFKPEHLTRLRIQSTQREEFALITPQIAAALTMHDAWTFSDGSEVLLCGGIVEHKIGDFVLWSAISADVGARMISLTRMAKRYLNLNALRIETGVRIGFTAGCRWAELLGFTRSGFDGPDHFRYVRGS